MVARLTRFPIAGASLLDYARPSLLAISSSSCSVGTNGTVDCPASGANLTISGTNFGSSAPAVFISGAPCQNVQVVAAQTTVSCFLAAGFQGLRVVRYQLLIGVGVQILSLSL